MLYLYRIPQISERRIDENLLRSHATRFQLNFWRCYLKKKRDEVEKVHVIVITTTIFLTKPHPPKKLWHIPKPNGLHNEI